MRATAENPNIAQLRFTFDGREDLNQNDLNFALRMFAEQGNLEMVDFLLNVGYRGINADPRSPAGDGYTAIRLIDDNIEMARGFGGNTSELIACKDLIEKFLKKNPSKSKSSCKDEHKQNSREDDENNPPPPPKCALAVAFSTARSQEPILGA